MEYATIITAIAALLTSLATLLIILEMKQQRAAISKPFLKLTPKSYELKKSEGSNSWNYEEDENKHLFRIALNNYGAGPAYNVLINWNLDIEGSIEFIEKLNPPKDMIFEFNGITLRFKDSFHNIKVQNEVKFDAIPVYEKGGHVWLPMPAYYFEFYKEYCQLGYGNMNLSLNPEAPEKLPPLPSLVATISYEDINAKVTTKEFKISFKIMSLTSLDTVMTGVSAYLSINE